VELITRLHSKLRLIHNANIRLGWKRLTVTNTLGYYNKALKDLIVQNTGLRK
jgi:hypothetical protein